MTAVAPFAARFPLVARGLYPIAVAFGAVGVILAIRMELVRPAADAHAYWLAVQGPLTYTRLPGTWDAYLYSPLFADLLRPLGLLPWPVFAAVWTVGTAALFGWLLAPLRRWAVPVWLLCLPEVANGNVCALLAVATVVGFRYPAVWGFPLLTKIVSGVGLLWFAVRGEWRRLAAGVVTIGTVVAVSYLLQPGEWQAWVRFLTGQHGGVEDGFVGLAARCAVGVVLVVVAARTDRRWLVPFAVLVVSPVYALTTVTVLTAIPRLRRTGGTGPARS